MSAAGTIDLSGTSAIGSLTRLRGQCRGAKERLSTAAVTSLVAELPGHRSDVRLTRNELDDAIRAPLADFVGVVQETLERNGIRTADLVAVASVGGGARIPIITTTLSEHFRVPVITTGTAGVDRRDRRRTQSGARHGRRGPTSMAAAPGAAAAAAAATAMAPEVDPQDAPASSTFRALAWSDADDVPDVAPTDPYEYDGPANGGGFTADARPQMQFDHDPYEHEAAPLPWYRRPALALVAGVLVLLAALTAAVLFVMRDDSTPAPASTTAPVTTTTPTPTTDRSCAARRPHGAAAADAGAPDPHRHPAGAAAPGDRDEAPPPPPRDVRGAATTSSHHGGAAADHGGTAADHAGTNAARSRPFTLPPITRSSPAGRRFRIGPHRQPAP